MTTLNLQCILCQSPYPFTTTREGTFDFLNHCTTCHIYYSQWYPSLKVDWVQYCYMGKVHDHYLVIDYSRNLTEWKIYYGDALNPKTIIMLQTTFPLMPPEEARKLLERLKNLKAFL